MIMLHWFRQVVEIIIIIIIIFIMCVHMLQYVSKKQKQSENLWQLLYAVGESN